MTRRRNRGAKYIWFSSSSKTDGTGSGSPVHLIGDPSARVVYVIEGLAESRYFPLSDRAHLCRDCRGQQHQPAGTVVSSLAQNGTEEIIEAHDMDKYNNQMTMAGASKIYLTARKYGMNCRRLTWNPNYKGFDDWQLALRRETNGERRSIDLVLRRSTSAACVNWRILRTASNYGSTWLKTKPA